MAQALLPMRAIKIKEIRATVGNLAAEIIPDKVIVQGEVAKQIFFVGEDNIVHHFPETLHFSTLLDIPGALPGMGVQIHPLVASVIALLTPNGDAIHEKVILDVEAVVTDAVQLRIVEDPAGIPIVAEAVVGEDTVQVLETQDVTLSMPAVKISEVHTEVGNLRVEVSPDTVVVRGDVMTQIFFVAGDGGTRHQDATIPFQTSLSIPGARPGMGVTVIPTVKDVNATLSPDGGVVHVEVLLDVFVKVTELVDINVTGGTGPVLKAERRIGQGTAEVMEESQVTLSVAASRLVDIRASVGNIRTRVIENKVIIQGDILKDVIFVDEAGLERTESFTIPFADFVDIPGASPGQNVFVRSEVRGVIFDPNQTGTLISEKVVVDILVTVTETDFIPVVTDPAGTLLRVNLFIGRAMKQVLVEEVIERVGPFEIAFERIVVGEAREVSQQELLENVIALPEAAIKIKRIDAVVTGVTVRVLTGKVLVEGTLHKEILFVSADNVVRSISEDIPFTFMKDLPGAGPGVTVTAEVEVESVIPKILPGGMQIQQLTILRVTVRGETAEIVQVITKLVAQGVTTTFTRIRAPVLRDTVPVMMELDVLTDATGPRVKSVTRKVIIVEVVGEGRRPLSVITDITFNY